MSLSNSARVVADADVLAADLLVGGDSRAALDHVRRHSWVELLASEPLLADATAVIDQLATSELATDWRNQIESECQIVDHPPGDHPGVAVAYRGEAGHLLTFEESLSSAKTNLTLKPHLTVSIRSPASFASLFDPESLYEALFEESYPGPDTD